VNGDALGFEKGGSGPASSVTRTAFGLETVNALVHGNVCHGSETCIALEHVDHGRVLLTSCSPRMETRQ
jgi:hypothetical protein